MAQQVHGKCTAFAGPNRIASGDLEEVALRAKAVIDQAAEPLVLIFDDATGELVEVDFRGAPADVLRRLAERTTDAAHMGLQEAAEPPRRGPGRPKLGVVAREITLLPRHWDWLNSQTGGASVALRRLVDGARRVHDGRDRVRRSQEAAYRFMYTMAGDAPGFEEAARALFAGSLERFDRRSQAWPEDIREHARMLAGSALTSGGP
jgi:hypothetical protein